MSVLILVSNGDIQRSNRICSQDQYDVQRTMSNVQCPGWAGMPDGPDGPNTDRTRMGRNAGWAGWAIPDGFRMVSNCPANSSLLLTAACWPRSSIIPRVSSESLAKACNLLGTRHWYMATSILYPNGGTRTGRGPRKGLASATPAPAAWLDRQALCC